MRFHKILPDCLGGWIHHSMQPLLFTWHVTCFADKLLTNSDGFWISYWNERLWWKRQENRFQNVVRSYHCSKYRKHENLRWEDENTEWLRHSTQWWTVPFCIVLEKKKGRRLALMLFSPQDQGRCHATRTSNHRQPRPAVHQYASGQTRILTRTPAAGEVFV